MPVLLMVITQLYNNHVPGPTSAKGVADVDIMMHSTAV